MSTKTKQSIQIDSFFASKFSSNIDMQSVSKQSLCSECWDTFTMDLFIIVRMINNSTIVQRYTTKV